jgi:hypothetical protein
MSIEAPIRLAASAK